MVTEGSIIWRMCIACWINKAIGYVIMLAYAQKLWFREVTSMLRLLSIACISKPLPHYILNTLRSYRCPDCASFSFKMAGYHEVIEN